MSAYMIVFAKIHDRDRFIKEYSFQSKQKGQAIPLPVVLSPSALNFTIVNWQLCAKSMETTAERSVLPSPANMLATIDYFRDKLDAGFITV